MIRKNRKIIYWIAVLIFGFGIYVVFIHFFFDKRRINAQNYPEIWSHRGMNDSGIQENSVQAFEYTKRKGVKGIETDIFWDEETKRLLISHDPLIKGKAYINLRMLLARFRDTISYWIDLKNLSLGNQSDIEREIATMLQEENINPELYIESAEGLALRKFKDPRIKKMFWVQYSRTFPKKQLKLLYLKTLIAFSSFDGISCAYEFYDSDFNSNFKGFSHFLFHLDKYQIEAEIRRKSSVRAVLADADYLSSLQ